MKKIFLYFLAIAACLSVQAQDSIKPFQISFITPMGTNGVDASNICNQFSINIFAGYNGSLKGVELGGFANVLKADLHGVQAAGFLNANLGQSQGGQFAGFANFSIKEFNGGIQASGFLNIVGADAKILQTAGFMNIVNGKTLGMQAAGFGNLSRGFTGAQLSGFSNFNFGEFKGLQASGFANFNTGSIKGGQISGFLNFATDVNGFQIGIINYSKTIKNGIPIGLISIVKDGYRQFEFGGNESFYSSLSYKTGHRKLYNILSAGASINNNKIFWGFGYGIGSSFQIGKKSALQIELVSYHVNEDEAFTDHLNSLNKLNLSFSYPLSKSIDFYLGPNFNVFVRKNNIVIQDDNTSQIIPWNFFDKTYSDDTRIIMYPGFILGFRINSKTN